MQSTHFLSRPAVLLVASLVGACSSSTGPTNSGHFLQFDANGTQVAFTIEASLAAAFSQQGSQYGALLTGFNANSNLSISIFDGAAITAKSYSGYGISGGAFVGVLITYQPAIGQAYSSIATPNSDAVVMVTEITNTEIKGTFSGTLQRNGQADIVATNGQFSLKRAN